jgi:hypothetical protein
MFVKNDKPTFKPIVEIVDGALDTLTMTLMFKIKNMNVMPTLVN